MTDEFLKRLQAEARKQSTLNQQRLLPAQFDWLTSLVGAYPWQTVTVLSALTAVIVTLASQP